MYEELWIQQILPVELLKIEHEQSLTLNLCKRTKAWDELFHYSRCDEPKPGKISESFKEHDSRNPWNESQMSLVIKIAN